MPNQPLQPFAPPTILLSYLHGSGFSAATVVMWFLFLVFIVWSTYTFVAVYHWFKYSNASWVMFPAVAAHLFVSFALMAYVLIGNGYFLAPYLP